MTQDEIIEMAKQGHASTRDAIRWAMAQEREACAKLCAEDGVQAMDFTGGTFVGGYFAKKIINRGDL